jgi:beta-lactamase class A
MRYEKAGRRFTLRDFAANMISLSDNTATDHLMRRLGREQLEAFLATAGHADPSINVPFLYTREWFMLKTGLTEEQVAAYLEAEVPKKRQMLTTEVAEGDLAVAESAYWEEPIRIETIEWFASASDICRVMATLKQMSERPGLMPIQELLSNRPGTTFDVDTWTYVGHKGGDETGVLNRTWLLRRTDGRWFVLTAGLNDPDVPLASGTASQLLIAAADLLAQSP